MSGQGLQVFLVVIAIWSVAGMVKATRALQTGAQYRFAMWDGGLLREGKVLTRRGTQSKAVVMALLALGCVAWSTQLLPFRAAQIALIALAAVSIVSDLIQTER